MLYCNHISNKKCTSCSGDQECVAQSRRKISKLQARIKELESIIEGWGKAAEKADNEYLAHIKELKSQLKAWRDWARDEMVKGPIERKLGHNALRWNKEKQKLETFDPNSAESEIGRVRRER